MKFRADAGRIRSPACGSTRAPATPAPTSATCGPPPAPAGTVTFTSETATGWQQVDFATPVAVTAEHHLRRVVLRAQRRTTPPTAATSPATGVDNAPLHALPNGDGRRQRRLPVRRRRRLPDQHVQVDQLLGRRRLHAPQRTDTTPPTVDRQPRPSGATGVPHDGDVTRHLQRSRRSLDASRCTLTGRGEQRGAPASTATTPRRRRPRSRRPPRWPPATTYTAQPSAGGQGHRRQRDGSASRWSFTTAASAAGCPCSIWAADDHAGDSRLERRLGRRARREVPRQRRRATSPACGSTRAPATPAPTSGHLWTTAGTRLATVDVHRRDARTGWQQVTFAARRSPVTANTTYVASYHAPAGHYAGNASYFARRATTTGRCTPWRTAPTAATACTCTAAGGFPTQHLQGDQLLGRRGLRHDRPPTRRRRRRRAYPGGASATGVRHQHHGHGDLQRAGPGRHASHDRVSGPGGSRSPATVSYDGATQHRHLHADRRAGELDQYTRDGERGHGHRRQHDGRRHLVVHHRRTAAAPARPGPGRPDPRRHSAAGQHRSRRYYRRDPAHRGAQRVRHGRRRHASTRPRWPVRRGRPRRRRRSRRRRSAMFTDLGATAGGNLIAMQPGQAARRRCSGSPTPATRSPTPTSRSTRPPRPGAGITDQTIQFHGAADRYTLERRHERSRRCTPTRRPRPPTRRSPCARRHQRRPGRRVHLRPRPLDRLHPAGQPGLGRPGARRPGARSAPTTCSSAATIEPTGST